MDSQEVVEIVGGLYGTTLIFTALSSIWIFDWLLTLGDEVKYAWRGGKTWAFWLFIANRYIPALYIIWINIVMFGHVDGWPVSCLITRWFSPGDTGLATIVAQLAVATRVYAVTGKKKLLCSPLALLVIMQAVWAIMTVDFYFHAGLQLPEEILDLFRICVFQRWDLVTFAYFSTALAFDTIAFSIMASSLWKQRPTKSLGITTIGSIIMRDGVMYFIIIFFLQFFAMVFLFRGPILLRFLPGVANPIVIPIMAAHLMLSLKKAAANRAEPSSFRSSTAILPGGGNVFTPLVFGTSRKALDTPAVPDEEELELGPVP